MTVEQNVIQHHSQKYQQVLLNQLRDATGTTDMQRLQQTLQACNGDLSKAVAVLVSGNAGVVPESEATRYLTTQSAGSQTDACDDTEELQKALAAVSLSESREVFRETGVSEEDQTLSRVLEASIAANKHSHSDPWSDLPNPHERKRGDACPVGLKNVGNTCWFSAVIQSLFHLLEFRRLVLLYTPPEHSDDLPRNQQESPSVQFVKELRRLFALMLASKRKYVDPSRALEILNAAFQSSGSQQCQQQDVSEFTHRLLDWLEEAFQPQEEREGEKLKNPLVQLFYGQFLARGVLEGKKFENTEKFGQFPLQVNGFSDLHECLEAATTEGEIESLHSENSGKSGQERWFTELPPVLTFELSRFQFNQAIGRPEKIHSRLEFPSVLYMDRYIYRNREVSQLKREEMRRLREQLTVLQQQLERYLSYGSGSERLPLLHVLQYAMEFASSQSALPSSEGHCPDSAAPSSGENMPSQPTPSSPAQDTPICPALQDTPTHPIPQDTPTHPIPQDTPTLPLPQDTPTCPALQDSPTHPVPQDTPTCPALQDTPTHPVPQDTPTHPVPQDTPTCPALQDTPTHPVPQDTPTHPVPQDTPTHPVPQDAPTHPIPKDMPTCSAPQDTPTCPFPQDTPTHPVPQDTPTHPVPQDTSTRPIPIPQDMPIHPVPQDTPTCPAPQDTPIHPVPQDTPKCPAPQGTPAHPAPQDTPTHPIPQDMPIHPNPQDTPTCPAPQDTPIHPIPQDTPTCPAPQDTPTHPVPLDAPTCPAPQKTCIFPAPRHITTEEGRVLEDCLRRWRTEVETDIRELQGRVSSTHGSIERINSDTSMMQVPYQLHAVLVHEGQASGGHYWAYIYSRQSRRWMRYNDITVAASTWEELVQESYGGHCNASAYCLMYVSTATPPEEVDKETALGGDVPDKLPQDLRAYVMEDNQLFEREVEEWDAAHCPPANQAAETATPESMEHYPTQATAPQNAAGPAKEPSSVGAVGHVERALSEAAAEDPDRSPAALLSVAVMAEYARLVKLAQQNHVPETDPRLAHAMVYFLQNQAPKKVLERAMFQLFADCGGRTEPRGEAACQVAREKVAHLKTDETETAEYETWHQEYEKFIKAAIFLLVGEELLQKKRYTDALSYLVFSSLWNRELLVKGSYRGHNQEVLDYYRRLCLLKLNERAAALFGSGGDAEVSAGLAILTQLVVPCLPLLLADHTQEADLLAVETIRNRWCSYLDRELEPAMQVKLTDVLPQLLDCSGEICSFESPPTAPPWTRQQLCERFRRVIASLREASANGT